MSDSRRPRVESAAFLFLLVGVATTPFPWGAVLPAGTIRLEILAFGVALLAAIAAPAGSAVPGRIAVPLLLGGAIGVEGAVQLVPLPAPLLRAWSPGSAEVHRAAAGVVAVFGKPADAARITIVPWETRGAILLLGAYLAIFWSAALLLRTRERRRLFLATLLVAATAHVVAAAATLPPAGRLRGAFVNPDHFAGYLEIALVFAFALIWVEILQGGERAAAAAGRAERIEKRLLPLAWRVLLWGFLAAGIVLTRSRGGIAAAALVTIVLLSLGLSRRGVRRASLVLALPALAFGVLFVAAATRGEALLRFLASDPRDIGADLRIAIWRTSFRAWRDFPVLGSGLGTFREAFRRVQTRELPGLVEHAHGDLLQILVTGGALGAALAAAAFATVLFLLLRLWRRQPHREESAVALAGFGALLSLTLHGAVDFNMSIPAIPAALAAALGAAWAAGCDGAEAARGRRVPETAPAAAVAPRRARGI